MTRPRRSRTGHLRLRTALLAAMLVPVLGVGALATATVTERWRARAASLRLADAASDVGRIVDAVARVADEQALTTVVSLSDTFDVPAPAGARTDLRDARRSVDALAGSEMQARLAPALAGLATLRQGFDAGDHDFDELWASFLTVTDGFVGAWAETMDAVEETVDDDEQPAWLRAQLRTLRESVEALVNARQRVQASLQVGLGNRDPVVVTELLRANARYNEAVERAQPLPGSRAAAAWDALHDDPAAVRVHEHLVRNEGVAFGTVPSPYATDMAPLVPLLDDGVGWISLLAETVRAAGVDLERSASAQVRADEQAMVAWVSAAVLVTLAAAAAAAALARRLVGPAADLAEAARRVAAGELAVAPVRARGVQEVVDTVEAFNDMVATLAAVERSAVALSGYPTADRPDPLPGRTGRALQTALDRLEDSVREVERQRADLAVLASHDELTGLLNRRAAIDGIERDLARVRRDGRSLAVLYVDLDGLKSLNDRFGHAGGDAALRHTAEALRTAVRDGDLVARLGGDEFVVTTIVDPDDDVTVDALADRLLAAVARSSIPTPEGQRPLACSVGVVVADPEEGAEVVLDRADAALYTAKAAGRSRAVWATRH